MELIEVKGACEVPKPQFCSLPTLSDISNFICTSNSVQTALSSGQNVEPNTVCDPVCSTGLGSRKIGHDDSKGGNPNNPLAAYVNHPPLLKWSGKSIKCRLVNYQK